MNSDTVPTNICNFSQSRWFQENGWSDNLHFIYWYRLYDKETGNVCTGPFNINEGLYSDTDLDILTVPLHQDATQMFRDHGINVNTVYLLHNKTYKFFVVPMDIDIYRKYHDTYIELHKYCSGYTNYDKCISDAIDAAMDMYEIINKNK